MVINNHFTFFIFCVFVIMLTIILSFIATIVYVVHKIKIILLMFFEKDRKIKDKELINASNCIYCQMFLEARENGWVSGCVPSHFCDSMKGIQSGES